MPRNGTHAEHTGEAFALGDATGAFREATEAWDQQNNSARLWGGDASLWTNRDENAWLGWLSAMDESREGLAEFAELADACRSEGFQDVVVMGMGGSSLCPDVFAKTFEPLAGWPRLRILDSTVPAQIRRLQDALDLSKTLFIVPSKSGTTIEPDSLQRRFFADLEAQGPAGGTAAHFIAITDPGSPLETEARAAHFRAVALGTPSIGGRFSALSVFGMLPACLAGFDAATLLERSARMAEACRPGRDATRNPGAALGIALGALARSGRDKLTFVISPGVSALGGWLEQLIAESTGKLGQGIIPIADEPIAAPELYGEDRVFAYLRLETASSPLQDAAVAGLEAAGHPVLRFTLRDELDLGAEFFRWEFATAVASSVLGVNPFDQPDVEAAKVAARELMSRFEADGQLPTGQPLHALPDATLFADPELPRKADLETQLASHLGRLTPGDYVSINAFIDMSAENVAFLERMRRAIRDRYRVATTVGFGPRFLHSTGQLHKGGPATGLFLQITAEDTQDLEVPGRGFSFGVLKQAQAIGDFQVLSERGRRILRIHLPDESENRVEALVETFETISAQTNGDAS